MIRRWHALPDLKMDPAQSSTAELSDTPPLEDKVAALTLSHEHDNHDTPSTSTSTNAGSSFSSITQNKGQTRAEDITYRTYQSEDDLDVVIDLVAPYLSEPYSVYCYRYFLHGW